MQHAQCGLWCVTHPQRNESILAQITSHTFLPKHQGIPEEIIGRRTKKGQPEYEIKWVGWTAAHNTWEPITNLAGYEGMVAAFEKVWQENYDKKSAEELIRKAAIKLVTATPPAVQPTGSRTPNDTIDDNSTESIIEVDASKVNEVMDGNGVPKKVKARAQRSILWNVNVTGFSCLSNSCHWQSMWCHNHNTRRYHQTYLESFDDCS